MSGKPVATLRGSPEAAKYVLFSPQHCLLATAHKSLCLWTVD